jgi:hypothetical protein
MGNSFCFAQSLILECFGFYFMLIIYGMTLEKDLLGTSASVKMYLLLVFTASTTSYLQDYGAEESG